MNYQLTNSRRTRLVIYLLGFAVIALIVLISYYQKQMHDETLESEEKQFTTILNIDCTMSNKSKSRLYFKDDRGQMQHVNVGYTDCKRYSIGDTIQIYKNKEGSWFELGQTK